MPRERINRERVRYQAFLNAEAGIRHHTHSEDMVQYDLMRAGDPRAVDEARKMLESDLLGTLSPDPVRNARYMFVAATTLVCRFAIDGGMPSEDSYNASDLFIQRMDQLRDADDIRELQLQMFAYYTKAMADLPKEEVYSPQVVRCIDHIRQHLNERVGTGELAEVTGLSPSYLSTLFKRETCCTVTEFVTHTRVETAKNMLEHSDYALGQISAALGFSSPSHFSRVFRAETGLTPKEWRRTNFAATGLRR